jgi:hypothetical protein
MFWISCPSSFRDGCDEPEILRYENIKSVPWVLTLDTLGSGDLFATDESFSEVVYAPGGFDNTTHRLEIFEDPGAPSTPVSATQDTQAIAATNSILFEGFINGETFDGMQAGLSTYSLIFDLSGTPPPPNVVPLPASVLLLLAALGGWALSHAAGAPERRSRMSK